MKKEKVIQNDERLGFPSASSMERDFACAGSRALVKMVERQAVPAPDTSSAAAEQGTLLHEANEAGDISDLSMTPAEHVKQIRAQEEEIAREWCYDIGANFSEIEVIREQRLWLHINGRSASVKIDTLCIAMGNLERRVLIIDAKSGRKSVTPPVRNWQLRTCLAAVAENYSGVVSGRTAIVPLWGRRAPACDHTEEDIKAIRGRLAERLELIEQPDQPRTVGDHCEHCPGKTICPEYREQFALVIRQRAIQWDLVPNENKTALYKLADNVEKGAKLLKEQIKADLSEGVKIPGMFKRPDGETRKVKDPWKMFLHLASVSPEQFIAASSISLESLAELYSTTLGRTVTKEEFEKWLSKVPEDIISKSPRSGTIGFDKKK